MRESLMDQYMEDNICNKGHNCHACLKSGKELPAILRNKRDKKEKLENLITMKGLKKKERFEILALKVKKLKRRFNL